MRDIIDYSHKYSVQPFEEIQVEYRRRKILERIKNYEHRTILEIGCGLVPFFQNYSDFNLLVIVEPSEHFYENAKTILHKDNNLQSKVILINDYLENAISKLSKYEFDFILVSGLIHELDNVTFFLNKLRDLLKKSTIVHANVPNARSFHRVLALEMGIIQTVFEMSDMNLRMQQHRVLDLTSFSELIINHGFKIIKSGSFFIKPFTHTQMSKLLETKIIDEIVLNGLYNMVKYIPDLGSEIFIEFGIENFILTPH